MARVESELQPTIKCRGAVLLGPGKSWEIRQIDLDPPRAGEVLVHRETNPGLSAITGR